MPKFGLRRNAEVASVVEPIIGLELPFTVLLGFLLKGEVLTLLEYIVIAVVFAGLFMTVTTHKLQLHYHKRYLEKGVIFAFFGAIGLALMNVYIGIASNLVSPLMTIWSTNIVLTVLSFIFLLASGKVSVMYKEFKLSPGLIVGQALMDNLGWVAYAYATIYIAVSIAIPISEAYIALAIILGISINRESLKRHQKFGMVLAVFAVLVLAYIGAK